MMFPLQRFSTYRIRFMHPAALLHVGTTVRPGCTLDYRLADEPDDTKSIVTAVKRHAINTN